MKKQYVFLHIEKTAGTSLVTYFQEVAKSSLLKKLIKTDSFKYIHPLELDDDFASKELQKLSIVAGHIGYDHMIKYMKDFYKITFFRDPIDRVLSFYDFAKEGPRTNDQITTKSKDLGMLEFFNFCEDVNDRRFVNGATHKMALLRGENELISAIENLSKIDFIGIQENFDESLAMLSYQNNWKMMEKVPFTNKTKKRSRKEDIPKDVIKKIIEINEDDIRLYNEALKIYDRNRKENILDLVEENQKLKKIV